MASRKGEELEEVVREYFSRQGFFAVRSINLRFEDEDITDVDVWSYGRQSANLRTRTIIDVKNKHRPKAIERILWTRGLQLSLGCDRAVVATTDSSDKVARFAQQQRVALLSKAFLLRLQSKIGAPKRLSLEQFTENIRKYADHKQDGDWLKQISDAKSSLISLESYLAFNKTMGIFKFFAERLQTRAQHRDQVLRSLHFVAALSCIALDAALANIVYEDAPSRYRSIADGVTYGDTGDAKTQRSIQTVLSVIAECMENGRAIARRAKDEIEKLFEGVRADIISEHFSKEHNATTLFTVARELDDSAFNVDDILGRKLSVEARSVLGVFADFVGVKRSLLVAPQSGEKRDGVLTTEQPSDITPGKSSNSMTEEKGSTDLQERLI